MKSNITKMHGQQHIKIIIVSSFDVCLVGLLFSHVFPARLWASVENPLLNTSFEDSAVTRDFRTLYSVQENELFP